MAKRGLGKGLGALIPTEDHLHQHRNKHAQKLLSPRPRNRRYPRRTKVPCTRRFPSTLCTPTPVNLAPFSMRSHSPN